MVTLEVWYNQEPDNDYAEGEPAILVETAAELDALIDRVQRETKGAAVPSMVECSVAGEPRRGVFDMGVGQEKGFLMFMTPEAAHTEGDVALTGHVMYDYMAHVREIPARYEVGIDAVRAGARAFLEAEILPTGRG